MPQRPSGSRHRIDMSRYRARHRTENRESSTLQRPDMRTSAHARLCCRWHRGVIVIEFHSEKSCATALGPLDSSYPAGPLP